MGSEENGKRPGPRRQDYGRFIGETFGFLRIDGLEGQNSRYRQLVRTTCLATHDGETCGKVTVKRLDKLQDGTTISCGCVKRALYLAWLKGKAGEFLPELRKQIWQDYQQMSRDELIQKHLSVPPTILDKIIREEQSRRRKKNIQAPNNAAFQAPDKDAPFWDKRFWLELKALHDTVEDTGFGKRQHPVFNSAELTFKRSGALEGPAAYLFEWAVSVRGKNLPEMEGLDEWLERKIDETRDHRKRIRKWHASRKRADK